MAHNTISSNILILYALFILHVDSWFLAHPTSQSKEILHFVPNFSCYRHNSICTTTRFGTKTNITRKVLSCSSSLSYFFFLHSNNLKKDRLLLFAHISYKVLYPDISFLAFLHSSYNYSIETLDQSGMDWTCEEIYKSSDLSTNFTTVPSCKWKG